MNSKNPTTRPVVRTYGDLVSAIRKHDIANLEIAFMPDFKGPSLAKTLNLAKEAGEDTEKAKVEFLKNTKRNPRQHQPAIDGFFRRIRIHVGAIESATIDKAGAMLASASSDLMISDINRMTLREFNSAWDKYVASNLTVEVSGGSLQSDSVSRISNRLTGKALRIFKFLVERKHPTSYESLCESVWEGNRMEDASIKKAIERLASKLNEMDPVEFEINNRFSDRRVILKRIAKSQS